MSAMRSTRGEGLLRLTSNTKGAYVHVKFTVGHANLPIPTLPSNNWKKMCPIKISVWQVNLSFDLFQICLLSFQASSSRCCCKDGRQDRIMHCKPLNDFSWPFMPLIDRTRKVREIWGVTCSKGSQVAIKPMAAAGGSQPLNTGLVHCYLPGRKVPTHCKPQYLDEIGQTSSSSVHAHNIFNFNTLLRTIICIFKMKKIIRKTDLEIPPEHC